MSQAELATKLKSGFLLLAGRSVFVKLLQVASSLLLAYKLVPADYGSFGIIYGFLSSLIFLTDIGLGDILIQRKGPLQENDLSAYMGMRFLLGLFWMLFFVAAYPHILSYYKFNFPYMVYVPALAIILPLEAFIGAAIVEAQKNMHYGDFAKIEMVEQVTLYLFQISLVYLNFGILSFFIAILVSRIVKAGICMMLLKFKVWPKFKFSTFSGHYQRGLFFQLNSIIPTSKAMILPVILALYLDIHTIGLIFWISSLVSIPLVLAYDYNHVLFPALANIQEKTDSARELASRSMEKMILVLAFVFGLGGVLGDQIISLVFNKNWADAKQLVFVCAAYHLAFSCRYITYPILYARNMASKRTLGEMLMVAFEYAAVLAFCKVYKAQGYFWSLTVINIMAFYFFMYFGKGWIRGFTFYRFHSAIAIVFSIYGLKLLVGLPTHNLFSLLAELVAFPVLFAGFFFAIDPEFRKLSLNTIGKMRSYAT